MFHLLQTYWACEVFFSLLAGLCILKFKNDNILHICKATLVYIQY